MNQKLNKNNAKIDIMTEFTMPYDVFARGPAGPRGPGGPGGPGGPCGPYGPGGPGGP
jgi:hypothetical protein